MFNDFNFQRLCLLIVPLLLALTAHEYAHGMVAYRLGDDTAARQGRLSFNPLVHLDVIGTLMLIMTSFVGWAKPVPVNPKNFKNPAKGMTMVALAGPLANFCLALIMAVAIRLILKTNLLFVMPKAISQPLFLMLQMGFFINIGLGIFNLLPIPPLDGFNVLAYFLPPRWVWLCHRYHMVCLIALIALMATGILGKILEPVFVVLTSLLLG